MYTLKDVFHGENQMQKQAANKKRKWKAFNQFECFRDMGVNFKFGVSQRISEQTKDFQWKISVKCHINYFTGKNIT